MRKILSIASLALLVAVPMFGTPRAVNANFPDGASGAWADQVFSYLPKLTRAGETLDPSVSDPWQALGPAEGAVAGTVIPAGSAVSLGFRGQITLKFDNTIINLPGKDLRIIAARTATPDTNRGRKLNEGSVLVEASQNCWKFYPIALVSGSKDIDLKISWAKCIQLTDRTSRGRPDTSDAYSLDGIEALHTMTDQNWSGTVNDRRYWLINDNLEDDTWLGHTLKTNRGEASGFCGILWDEAIAFNNNWVANPVDGNEVAFQDAYYRTFGRSRYDNMSLSELHTLVETMTCTRQSYQDRGMKDLTSTLKRINKGQFLFTTSTES